MEQKNNFESYLKTMFEYYKDNNFESFVNKILSYNIAIGSYKKDISIISKKIFTDLLKLDFNKNYVIYNEYDNYFYIENIDDKKNKKHNILLDIPVFEDNYEFIANSLVKYCFENNINFSIKLNKKLKNTIFQMRVFKVIDANKIIDYFTKSEEISKLVKSRTLPFLYQINLIGVYTEISPYSFKNIYIKYLYHYYSKYMNESDINIESFLRYIEFSYKNEKELNKKRMLNIIYHYILIIYNNDDIFNLFEENLVMELSSFQGNDFIIKYDENEMIYFIDKEDNNIEIRYESEDFFNIAYAKYYENIIKKDTSDKYYKLFYDTFDNILVNNYKNIENILDLLNPSMDKINKILLLSSSLYFAYKKMNFSFRQIKLIMDYLISIMDNYEKKENNQKDKIISEYIISDEYANKIVNLKNGTSMTIKKYILDNNIINNIPENCIVELKNGNKITVKEFINNIYNYIPNYNSYLELINDLVDSIEY